MTDTIQTNVKQVISLTFDDCSATITVEESSGAFKSFSYDRIPSDGFCSASTWEHFTDSLTSLQQCTLKVNISAPYEFTECYLDCN